MNKKLFDQSWWKIYERKRAQRIEECSAARDAKESEDMLLQTLVKAGAPDTNSAKDMLKEALQDDIHKRSAKKYKRRPMKIRTRRLLDKLTNKDIE